MTQLRNVLEGKGFYRIPLKKLKSGHYKFSAKINSILGNFILDTGASTSCIGFNSISYFSLKSEASSIKAAGAGAINMKTKLARNNSISIGLWNLNKIDFVLFDLTHVNEALQQVKEESVHGIIGADFLKKTRAVIDYGRNCLYVK
ncbi:MAG: clan AA aspartic protease [Bacteroidetes bacterium]|nr:clan AA aspartic protease [Bacteroidota bacterium]